MKRIVIFASGSGSNAENIVRYFQGSKFAEVVLVLTNNREAQVLERCVRLGIPAVYFNRHSFYDSDALARMVSGLGPDLIVLAGFLWKIPESLLRLYPQRIINIHPALLPKFGGKGMYGQRVHRAVIDKGEKESGMTIHYVNEAYDEGGIISQVKIPVLEGDTPETLAKKVHELEYSHLPRVIEQLLLQGNG